MLHRLTLHHKNTAAAIKETKTTGKLVGWSDHVVKWESIVNGLQKLFNGGTLNPNDLEVATKLFNDLKDALK